MKSLREQYKKLKVKMYPGLSISLNKLCMRPYKWYNWKMTDDILKLPCDLVWWTAKQPEKAHLRTDINPWKKSFDEVTYNS